MWMKRYTDNNSVQHMHLNRGADLITGKKLFHFDTRFLAGLTEENDFVVPLSWEIPLLWQLNP